MEPTNGAVSPAEVMVERKLYRTNFCSAKTGETYLVSSLNGGSLITTLAAGKAYQITQMDPRTGERTDLERVDGGTQTISVSGRERVLLVTAI